MIGFLLGFLAGYAVMYVRHAAQVRETNKRLELILAGLKAQNLPTPNEKLRGDCPGKDA